MTSLEMHNFDFTDFNKVLNSYTDDVFLVTNEGDRLNLKSKLCQLIGFTKLIRVQEFPVHVLSAQNKRTKQSSFDLIFLEKNKLKYPDKTFPYVVKNLRLFFCVFRS